MPIGVYERKLVPVEARFWPKVNKNGPNGCWLWTGGTDNRGYGQIGLPRKKLLRAHRFSWTLRYGQIPDGLWVLHRCDVPACVNPDHLFLGDNTANQRDAASKGRSGPQRHPQSYPRKSSCVHGHAFTPENTAERKGKRYCRECERRRSREYAARKKVPV